MDSPHYFKEFKTYANSKENTFNLKLLLKNLKESVIFDIANEDKIEKYEFYNLIADALYKY